MGRKGWFSKKSMKNYLKDIEKSDWSETKTFVLPDMREGLNEGLLSQMQFEELKNKISKKHKKESWEL